MRVACLYVPHFYLQVEYLKDPSLRNKPVVIIGLPQEKGYIMDCSEELSQRGIVSSMPLKDAYHLCYDAALVLARKREYGILWDEVLSAIASITLRIESQEPGTVFLDITRLPGMYKSEEQVASVLSRMISEKFFFDVKIGTGNSRFIARQAALRASKDGLVIPSGAHRQFLASVSIDSLPVPDDIRERLYLLGLNSLGQIGAFTLSALTSQFGATGKELWEISNGVSDRNRIPCAFAITDIDREIICDQPVSSKQEIKATLLELLDGLSLELEELGKACRTVKITFDLDNRTFFEKQFYLHDPTVHKEDMLRRMMTGLEGIELESPIRIMSVRAGSLVNYNGKQEKLFRNKTHIEKGMKEIRGFLKTKYGTMPLARAVRNDSSTLVPDDRFIFVEP
ncbi:MAG: DNA polymerase Y family protein [Syntrophorhabdaceae bacterium]